MGSAWVKSRRVDPLLLTLSLWSHPFCDMFRRINVTQDKALWRNRQDGLFIQVLLTEQHSHDGLIHAGTPRGIAGVKVRVCAAADRHMTACSHMHLQPLPCGVFHTVPGRQRVNTLFLFSIVSSAAPMWSKQPVNAALMTDYQSTIKIYLYIFCVEMKLDKLLFNHCASYCPKQCSTLISSIHSTGRSRRLRAEPALRKRNQPPKHTSSWRDTSVHHFTACWIHAQLEIKKYSFGFIIKTEEQ